MIARTPQRTISHKAAIADPRFGQESATDMLVRPQAFGHDRKSCPAHRLRCRGDCQKQLANATFKPAVSHWRQRKWVVLPLDVPQHCPERALPSRIELNY